jgi:pimeloyl-ACP methyl ester carboxylesterase
MVSVEEVVRNDFIVVVGSMRKCPAAIAVPQRPNAGHVSLQLIINDDVAAMIGGSASPVQTQVSCVGSAPYCQENASACNFRRTFFACDADGDTVIAFLERDTFSIQPDMYALSLQYFAHSLGNVFVLPSDQARPHFHNRNFAPEAAKNLGELQPNITSPDDDEMLRQEIDVHVVIPLLPGYGFSAKPTAPGWTPVSIARAWATLMQHLGYTRYVAQGGDWGNAVSEVMALQRPPGLLGIHTNMAATVPPDVSKALSAGGPPPAGLSAEEKHAWDQLDDFYKNGLGYAQEMSNRPQSLYGIADSPVGLAAWMLDHDILSYKMISRAFDGKMEGLTRDDVLDNVTLYWLTNTAVSSARLYWDTARISTGGGFFDVRGVTIPVAVSAFPDEIYAAPKSWAERAYPKLIYYNRPPKGGHFAAWEQPQLFTAELRAAFRSLR